jgi:hypothetical protein
LTGYLYFFFNFFFTAGELWGNVEASTAIRQAAHEKLAKDAGKQWKWRAQSVGKLEQVLMCV